MARVVLLTGSNEGDKRRLLEQARASVAARVGEIVDESAVYESEPWGFSADETFLNQVLVAETRLEPLAVLDEVQAIERELGRVRRNAVRTDEKRVYESRPIDIDILFYDREIIDSARLTVPHPLIAQREFVLIPLREVMPDYIHPVLQKAIKDL